MIALEYIADRLTTLLADRRPGVPAEAVERIAELETALAKANARLIAEGHASERLAVELPVVSQAVADLQVRFDELIVDARAEVPPPTQTHIADMEKRLAAQTAELGEIRKQCDECARAFGDLEMLRDAALQWRKDSYTPRLQAAIDTFSRRQVVKR